MNATIEKLFGFDAQKHNVRTEIMAGITTFLTMAYILAVNPNIFSALPGMPWLASSGRFPSPCGCWPYCLSVNTYLYSLENLV